MQKLYDSYRRMNDTYKASKSLSPYLWRTKKSGSIRKNVQPNDVMYLYIKGLDKLGVVQKLAESQLHILYKDNGGHIRKDWILKEDLRYIVSGKPLIKQKVPDAVFEDMNEVTPAKEMDAWE